MSPVAVHDDEIRELLAPLRAEVGVPGIVVGIQDGAERRVFAEGTTRVEDGTPVRPDTLFQVGSITKVVTATLVMSLVDRGLIALDDPVVRHLPGLRIGGDADRTAGITVEHLLTHTGGMDGDFFPDFGRGDDAITAYVAAMDRLAFRADPGRYFSYSNSGFVLLGRLVEVLTGLTFDRALRSMLIEPLGLLRTVTTAEEAILQSTAIGHLAGPGGEPQVAGRWSIYPSVAPAGAVLTMAAGDVLDFARLHMDDRTAELDGVLPAGARDEMRRRRVLLPGEDDYGVGLAWGSTTVAGDLMLSHSGETIGQCSLLHVFPTRNRAVVVLTNSESGQVAANQLARTVMGRLGWAELPGPDVNHVDGGPPEPRAVTGRFGALGVELQLTMSPGRGVTAEARQQREDGTGTMVEIAGRVVARDARTLVVVDADESPAFEVIVLERDRSDRPTLVFALGRVLARQP